MKQEKKKKKRGSKSKQKDKHPKAQSGSLKKRNQITKDLNPSWV
jgi:hypothetical protein